MESYLKYTLGLHATIHMWEDSNTLPDELRENREYLLLELFEVKCLVITALASEFQMSVFLKEKEQLRRFCEYPLVLCFDRITSYQRKCLIENHQAFIVPENQLFMPFLGIALQEHFKANTAVGSQMTAMAQYVLLFYLYDKTDAFYSKLDLSKSLGISLMNVTRSVQELEELGLLMTRKKGRSSMVAPTCNDRELLLEQARPYLRDPVQKRLYVRADDWLLRLPAAGTQALSRMQKQTDNTPYPIRAIEKRVYLDAEQQIHVIDPSWDVTASYIQLEVWRYNPARYTDGTTVDSLSLALSLEGEDESAEKMNIKKLWKE